MQVIFDEKLVPRLRERYTVLELDTIMQPGMDEPVRLHAVIDRVGLNDITNLDNLVELHAQMISHYKSGEWDLVPHAVEPLMGHWQQELDSFYLSVLDFSAECAKLNTKWDGVKHTVPNE